MPQWFLPLHNPLGFGAVDFIELELAALLVLLILAHSGLAERVRRLAGHTGWCMLFLAILPVALRLALLRESPAPIAAGADDFAHLLVADTLRHWRLANPVHSMHRFFETIFVLQEPSYSSIFPIGPGMVLALGRMVFGHPWAGVVLSVAGLCSLCYWALRGWTSPGWALVGGLLAIFQFGPLRYWMNTYWGGAVSAAAGCLVFGALPRLRERGRAWDAVILGAGMGIQLLTRPFEFVLMASTVTAYLLMFRVRRGLAFGLLGTLPAVCLMPLHNKQVTGEWSTLPYVLSRYQYGVPATLTVQANPTPHRELTANQELDYQAQRAAHGEGVDTFRNYLVRLGERIRFYRFFLPGPAYLALPLFVLALRDMRFAWVSLTLIIFAFGSNFYPYFYPHYIAAAACLWVLAVVTSLERLSRVTLRGLPAGREAAVLIVLLCAAQFLFWYGFHLFARQNASLAIRQYETWNFVNHGDPTGRVAIRDRLAQAAGQQLVFVRYSPRHLFDEWVQNEAVPDGARVVWALDRGAEDNENLRHYYPLRTTWLLEADARPPRLTPYQVEAPPPPTAPPPPARKKVPEYKGIQLLPVE